LIWSINLLSISMTNKYPSRRWNHCRGWWWKRRNKKIVSLLSKPLLKLLRLRGMITYVIMPCPRLGTFW